MAGNKRLLSLDFFRGITIAAMILVNNPGSWSHVYPPLLHSHWHGWTFTDLIFPFFLFIVGVSIALALAAKKVAAGSYDRGQNFSAWLDNLLLQGHMWSQTKTWDPEGVFSTLPAIATTLIGVLTGHLLSRDIQPLEKVTQMLVAGIVAIGIAMLWAHWLPINKSLWTSSYALFMSGMALVFLGICYYLIDIKGWRKGIQPFRVYGMNAITVFVLSGIVGRLLLLIKWQSGPEVITLKEWLMDSLFLGWLSPLNASLAYALSFVFLSYIAMYILYNKQIFIKV